MASPPTAMMYPKVSYTRTDNHSIHQIYGVEVQLDHLSQSVRLRYENFYWQIPDYIWETALTNPAMMESIIKDMYTRYEEHKGRARGYQMRAHEDIINNPAASAPPVSAPTPKSNLILLLT